ADRPSPLVVLGAVLGRFPADKRVRVDELRISGSQLQIQGQAAAHADADAIAQQLGDPAAAPPLAIDPIKTELLGDNLVSFVVTGALRSPRSSPSTSTARGPE